MKASFQVTASLVTLCITGCYYDKEELLSPVSAICDTAIATLNGSVKLILTTNGQTCD